MKKNLTKKWIMLGVFSISILTAKAQFTLDAEFRFNPVQSRGFRLPLYDGEKPGFYTMQRSRLILNYVAESDLKMEVVVQDRRFWGDQNERADVPNLGLFRAWVEKKFTSDLSLKIGRQGLVYDDQFIFGELNWGGTLAHDAAVLKYESDFINIHFGAAYNANGGELKREHYNYNMPKSMQFAWLNKKFGKLTTSVLAVNHGVESADTAVHYTQLIGTNNSLKVNDFLTLKGIYYYQLGEDLTSTSVNAYLLSAQAVIKLSDKITLNPGVDINSGTDGEDVLNPEYSQNNTFDRYFGLLHAQFGRLDYFFVKAATQQGVQDYYLKANIKAGKFSVKNELHGFVSDKTILHTTTAEPLDDFLGVENDIRIGYQFSDTFKATLGHSIMFGTSTLDHHFGGTPIEQSQYFYAVITANPKLF